MPEQTPRIFALPDAAAASSCRHLAQRFLAGAARGAVKREDRAVALAAFARHSQACGSYSSQLRALARG